MKNQMTPKEFFNYVMEMVKNANIVDMFDKYGFEYVNSSGSRKYTDCFICGATIKDKVSNIHEKHNGFICYKCPDTPLSHIDYIMQRRGLSFKAAIFDIAVTMGMVSQSDVDDYYDALKLKKPIGFTKPIAIPTPKREVVEKNIASDEVLNKVFSIFSLGYSVIEGKSKLSNEHLDYLRQRNLTDEDIISGGYFTLPRANMVSYICKALKEKYNLDETALENVPGFYRNKSGKITFKYYDAIGIPIINAKGLYKGIQIRLNKEIITKSSKGKEKKLRYIWLSSEEIPDGCTCGVSPGTPVDVIYPKTDKSTWSKNLFITEGKFKAQQLSKQTNAIVMSVQGVANWRDIPEEINEIQKTHDNLINRIFVTYDADIAYKDQVNMHATTMSDALTKEFPSIPLLYCVWNPDDGKGIDDLIFNNKLSTVKTVKKKVYDTLYSFILKNIKEQKLDYRTLPDEAKLKIFIECIYNRI